MSKIIFSELSYKLTGVFYKVQNELGRFCTEKQYTDAVEQSFRANNTQFLREKNLSAHLTSADIKGIIPDFVVENKIIVDLKTKKFITKDDYNQMMKYLQLLGLKLGLIVNFRSTYLKPKRVINYKI